MTIRAEVADSLSTTLSKTDGFAHGRYFEHWFDDVRGGATFG